jgi:dTDP-6-deoxy-L-talose 4-dehydrogenase (NAD+)
VKIAVTGARGFLGRHVVDELVKRGIDTVATYRKDSRRPPIPHRSVHSVSLDIAKSDEACFEYLGEPNALIHLAWDALPNYWSLDHFEVELPRQYRFLSALVKGGLSSLVTAGTCFEYGMQSGALAADQPTSPTNPYGYAKDALRKQLQLLQAAHPFRLTWARLFYMYGEGQSAASLLPMLERAVADGLRTFPMSGGEQLRDYLPVVEVARQLVDLAVADGDAGVINVCSGRPISVRRLVEQWIHERGWVIDLELGKLPYSDYEPLAFWGVPTLSQLGGQRRVGSQ